MRKIPQELKDEIASDPYYDKCCMAFRGGCDGRITIEHAIIFAGKQLNELWALLPICEWHHAVNKHQDGGDLNKEMNVLVALNRATTEELLAISKAINYLELRERLNKKYGLFIK